LHQLLKTIGRFNRSLSLRWRLTLSYTLVTVGVVLALEGVFLVIADQVVFGTAQFPAFLATALDEATPSAAPFLESASPDRTGLATWLGTQSRFQDMHLPFGLVVPPNQEALLVVVDSAGMILASSDGQRAPVGDALGTHISPAAAASLRAGLTGSVDRGRRAVREADGRVAGTSPIVSSSGEIVGGLFLDPHLPGGFRLFVAQAIPAFIKSAVPLTIIFGLMGTLFGYAWARWITRRLRSLAVAVEAWSRGYLDVTARDVSDDELGQLARQLNRMAEQLQTLLQTRQELAIVDERNRLARDLHDAVKQQVFATAMQVGAARALLERNPTTAGAHLAEAERLASQAQQELAGLIRELRPAALTDKGLAAALQGEVREWSRRTNVAAEVRIQGERSSPLAVEQGLFRVAQEALSNVARHSAASAVEVHLAWEGESLMLTVSDNGRGFDPERARGKGLGLTTMRERIEDLGGTFRVASGPDGTLVESRVRAPTPVLPAEAAGECSRSPAPG